MELNLLTSTAIVYLWPGSTPEDASAGEDDAPLICFVSLSIPSNVAPPSKMLSLNIGFKATENVGVRKTRDVRLWLRSLTPAWPSHPQFQRAGYETNHPFDFSRDCESAVDMPLQSGKVYR